MEKGVTVVKKKEQWSLLKYFWWGGEPMTIEGICSRKG